MTTRLALLGATGSIGRQVLDVVAAHPDRLSVKAVAARHDAGSLEAIGGRLRARVAIEERDGPSAVAELAQSDDIDLVVVAIPGFAALRPTLAALASGKTVAIASKEVLVVGGHLVRQLGGRAGDRLRPIDGEHCAVWQCLRGEDPAAVERVTLTASGGAFRDLPLALLADVTPEAALRHPTWRMGPKITVDSATLVNKAYELIEAHWLFDLPYDRVGTVLHPESVVHALVEFRDGSVKAQLSAPDMRLFIQYALLAPERLVSPAARLRLGRPLGLSFQPLDPVRYPCFGLVLDAARRGAAFTVAANAADEVAVARFLRREIAFNDIAREIERGLEVAARASLGAEPDFEAILEFDEEVRRALTPKAEVA